jgi:hypothetical protein
MYGVRLTVWSHPLSLIRNPDSAFRSVSALCQLSAGHTLVGVPGWMVSRILPPSRKNVGR